MIRDFSSFDYSAAANQAVTIARAGLEAVQPEALLRRAAGYDDRLKRLSFAGKVYDLDDYDRIFIVGIGSGTARAAEYFRQLLRGLPLKIFVMDPEAAVSADAGVYSATRHPTAANAEATSRLLAYGPFSQDDLVIAVTDSFANYIVNAGSEMPPDQQGRILAALGELGAAHEDIMVVASHLAGGRGGDLARLMSPARILNYVIANRLDSAGQPVVSSPFIPHGASLYDAKSIIEKYQVLLYCDMESCAFVTIEVTDAGSGVSHAVLASPLSWLEPMKFMAQEFGLAPQVFTAPNLEFRQDPDWRQTHAESHCLLSLFPHFDPRTAAPEPYDDFTGTELYLGSGIFGEPAGFLLSGRGRLPQEVIPEFPTFNVGAMGLRLT